MSPLPPTNHQNKDILGQWKNFEFRFITDTSQYPAVLEHLHANFFLSTPLTSKLEYSKEYFDEFDKIYLTTLPQKLSLCAIDLETNEIAGLRITYVQDKALEKTFESLGFKTEQMRIMNLVMGTVNMNSKIYERYDINSFVNFYTACVDPKYRGQGLATEMYEQALKFVRANKGFKYVKSNLTSPWTRKICHKYGFMELARAYYNDFKDEDGNKYSNDWNDDEFVAFMCLKLEQ